MAFLGDFGKIFLGGADTGQVVTAASLAMGADPASAYAYGNVAQQGANTLSSTQPSGETTQTQTVASSPPINPASGGFNVEMKQVGQPNMPMSNGIQQGSMLSHGRNQRAVHTAFIPTLAPAAGGAAAAIGAGAAVIYDWLTGTDKKLIITRKLKRETEDLMEIYNNNLSQVANQLSAMKKKTFTEDIIVDILLHKFKSQGAYVTKAAVRKTRRTINKLETLKCLHERICGSKRTYTKKKKKC